MVFKLMQRKNGIFVFKAKIEKDSNLQLSVANRTCSPLQVVKNSCVCEKRVSNSIPADAGALYFVLLKRRCEKRKEDVRKIDVPF